MGSTLVEVLGEELGGGGSGGYCRGTGKLSGSRTPALSQSHLPVPATATDGEENTPAPVGCLLSPKGPTLVKALFRSSAT